MTGRATRQPIVGVESGSVNRRLKFTERDRRENTQNVQSQIYAIRLRSGEYVQRNTYEGSVFPGTADTLCRPPIIVDATTVDTTSAPVVAALTKRDQRIDATGGNACRSPRAIHHCLPLNPRHGLSAPISIHV